MNFDSTDPLTSRERFMSRRFDNTVHILAYFIPGMCVLSIISTSLAPSLDAMLLIDVAAIIAACYFYKLWEKRPIRLCCPTCEEAILSITPWVCKACSSKNTNTDEFPFLFRCESCQTQPKSYKCHHCGELIFLSQDHDRINYAFCLNSPDEAPKPDERVEKARRVQETKLEKIEEIEILRLDEQLKAIQKRLKMQERRSAAEALNADVASEMELDEAVDKLKAEKAEQLKGNEAEIERVFATIDECARRQLRDR